MPVPKRKRSRARRDSRFANKGLAIHTFVRCPNCDTANTPHTACKECGHYKGVKVLATKAERTVTRTQVRQAKASRVQAAAPAETQE